MPEQFSDLGIRHAVGKGIGGEAVPVAVGDGFQPCLLAQTSQPPADGLCREPLAVLTRKQKPLRVLGDLLTQDAHGFWTEEDDPTVGQTAWSGDPRRTRRRGPRFLGSRKWVALSAPRLGGGVCGEEKFEHSERIARFGDILNKERPIVEIGPCSIFVNPAVGRRQ